METLRGRGLPWRMALGLTWLGLAAGCASDFDTSRASHGQQSFGETAVELACKRMAHLHDLADDDGRVDVSGTRYRAACRGEEAAPADAPDHLRALLARRNELAFALDSAAPESYLPELQALLTSEGFLALYDDDSTTAAVDAVVASLRFAADDPERAPALHDALVRMEARTGYRPLDAMPGLMGAMIEYPELDQSLRALTGAIAAGGSAESEWNALLAAMSASMRHAEKAPDPAAPERVANLVLGLLLTTDPLLASSITPDQALELVRRDHRGVAAVQVGAGGQMPAPFVDLDGDGLADLDDVGRFIDATGAVIEAPAPYELAPGQEREPWPHRDEAGRALAGEGGPLLYQHVALDATLLAAAAREVGGLMAPERGAVLDLVRGSSVLLGDRVDAVRSYESGETLAYRGFDTGTAALLDMIHGYLQVLRDPVTDDVLALADELLRNHEPELARIAEAVISASRLGEAYSGVALEPGSPLWDDLMPVLQDIAAEPGLIEDLLVALEQPEVAELGARFASYMKYKDRFSFDADQNVVGSFSTEVDRGQPDQGFDRSLWQRLLHVIADANGDTLCSKPGARVEEPLFGIDVTFDEECDLFAVENTAVLFVQSIAYARDSDGDVIFDDDGNPLPKAELVFNSILVDLLDFFIDLDDFLESRSGIAGFTTHPTPQALSRMLFLQPSPAFVNDVIDPPRCRDGHLYTEAHADTLQVWEADGFYDDVRPIVQVFADHDAEILFVELLAVLHEHWPSPGSGDHQHADPGQPDYVWGSNAVAFEPLIVDILGQEALLPALVETAPTLNAISVQGRPYSEIVVRALRYVIEPREGLARRDGATETQTNDGRPVPVLSPWYVLADAYARRDAALSDGEDRQAWERAGQGLFDALLRGEEMAGAGWSFRSQRARGVLLVLVSFLRDRIAAHEAAGDRDEWLASALMRDIEDTAASPLAAAIVDLGAALARDPDARAPVEGVLAYMLDQGANGEGFVHGLIAVADLLQKAMRDELDMIPVAHAFGEIVRPERGWVAPVVRLLQGASQSDTDGALAGLLRNLFTPHRRGHTPLGEISESLAEVNRARPYSELGQAFARDDYPAMLRGVADFMDEERRGLRKFIAIVKGRNL
ncbi:MAG TPA: hypothetical protein VNM90_11120 [Haliangium sp.]|nr:hypothetical protein [Haliangium sp.]